jgi:hypothetical protein
MHDQSAHADTRRLERAIVLLLLGEKHASGCSRDHLADALDADAQLLERSLERLSQAGVIDVAGTDVRATAAALRIDELGLIGI